LIWIRLAGVPRKCFLFTLRLSFSGKAAHRVNAPCGQEAFLEGHVHAFGRAPDARGRTLPAGYTWVLV
jgi:hypothetical protein